MHTFVFPGALISKSISWVTVMEVSRVVYMSTKARKLSKALVKSMQGNDWHDDDIKFLMGKNTLHPSTIGLGALLRMAELYAFWLQLNHRLGGLPNDLTVLDDIDQLTKGKKSRYREQKLWNQERIKVYEIRFTRGDYGPAMNEPIVKITLSSCNLHCNHCLRKPTWDKGTNMSADAIRLTVNEIHSVEKILSLTGGEPLIWQDKVSFIRLLCNWAAYGSVTGNQIHIQTNGTILPRKMIRDMAAITTVVPPTTTYRDLKYWKTQIKQWENIDEEGGRFNQVFYAPSISKSNKKTRDNALKLFGDLPGYRIYPRPMTKDDKRFTQRFTQDVGWMDTDVHYEGGVGEYSGK